MILVIDSSASTAAVALVGREQFETTLSARSQELIPELRRLAAEHPITKVAVATGPGSFTGLRVGAAFALGLAIGRRIPIIPLPSLALQAARSKRPATAVVEAGRGRFYFQSPAGAMELGDPPALPKSHPIVGRLSAKGEAALVAAGHQLVQETELRPFAEAAQIVVEGAREVAYDGLELQYVQSFTARG